MNLPQLKIGIAILLLSPLFGALSAEADQSPPAISELPFYYNLVGEIDYNPRAGDRFGRFSYSGRGVTIYNAKEKACRIIRIGHAWGKLSEEVLPANGCGWYISNQNLL
ncbi:MAG: hypothetical protein AAF512_24040, partial [Pseudomonadota bacterium]